MRWEKVRLCQQDVGGVGEACPGPGKRWGHTCNSIKGGRFLYVFGGYGKDNCQTNQVHVFDTGGSLWKSGLTFVHFLFHIYMKLWGLHCDFYSVFEINFGFEFVTYILLIRLLVDMLLKFILGFLLGLLCYFFILEGCWYSINVLICALFVINCWY